MVSSIGSEELTFDYSLSVSFSRIGAVASRDTLPQGAVVPGSANGFSPKEEDATGVSVSATRE